MMTSFFRVTKFAVQNFLRDIWLSSVTIIIFILAITLVCVLSGVKVITDQAIDILRTKADITVTFKPTTQERLVLDLKSRLEQLPETTSVTFQNAAENFQAFKQAHATDPVIMQGTQLVGQNPIGPSLVIHARSLEDYGKISAVLQVDAYQNEIESGGKALETNQDNILKLSRFTTSLDRFSISLTAIFSIIAILVVLNTMRIAIYSHREEIGIMKLVGASNWFVRLPFIIESVFVGILAAILASAVIVSGITLLNEWFNTTLFRGYDVHMSAYFFSNFISIFWMPLVGAVIISIVSASIAVGRYLKV